MDMDIQTAFNLAIGLVAALGGWWMKTIYDALMDLRRAETTMVDRVQRIEVLVAGQYVTREELGKLSDAIFRKLDKIEVKIDERTVRRRHDAAGH